MTTKSRSGPPRPGRPSPANATIEDQRTNRPAAGNLIRALNYQTMRDQTMGEPVANDPTRATATRPDQTSVYPTDIIDHERATARLDPTCRPARPLPPDPPDSTWPNPLANLPHA